MKARFLLLITGLVYVVLSCDYKPRNQGRALYRQHCENCHLAGGEGLGALIPPVKEADYVIENAEKLSCIIRHGMEGEITVNAVQFDSEMPSNSRLTEVQIANLVHYILVDLNNQEETFNLNEIKSQLAKCP